MKAESGNGDTSIGVSSLSRLGVNLQDLENGLSPDKAWKIRKPTIPNYFR